MMLGNYGKYGPVFRFSLAFLSLFSRFSLAFQNIVGKNLLSNVLKNHRVQFADESQAEGKIQYVPFTRPKDNLPLVLIRDARSLRTEIEGIQQIRRIL
jgi:hypothetical protein